MVHCIRPKSQSLDTTSSMLILTSYIAVGLKYNANAHAQEIYHRSFLPFPQFTVYKASANPKNPTAPTMPAAITLVGAAPALLEVEGALVEDALAVGALVDPVVAPVAVVPLLEAMVLLLTPVAVALAVEDAAVPVPAAPETVINPAATSRE